MEKETLYFTVSPDMKEPVKEAAGKLRITLKPAGEGFEAEISQEFLKRLLVEADCIRCKKVLPVSSIVPVMDMRRMQDLVEDSHRRAFVIRPEDTEKFRAFAL